MRAGLPRSFHTGRVSYAFRRATGNNDGGSSTPRKSNGEFRWFKEAAPYSKLDAKAPEVTADKVTLSVATPDMLKTAAPGQLITWPSEIQAQLHHLGTYKPNQQNELFRQRVSLIRQETQRLWGSMLKTGKSIMITGDAGIGKTSLLTQAHGAAKLQNWGVLHISQADKLLDGSTDAVYNGGTGVWDQPMFVSRLWKKTVKANRTLLGAAAKQPVGNTLTELIKLFEGHKLLVSVDNINALNHRVYAQNTDTENKKLYHGELEVVNTILKCIKNTSNNIAVVVAASGHFKKINWEGLAYSPITDYDPTLVGILSKAERLDVGHLDSTEAKAYVDYLHAAEVTTKPWEEIYQAGNGNLRSMLATATNYAY